MRRQQPLPNAEIAQLGQSIMSLHDKGLISINDNHADCRILPRQ